MKGTLPFVDSEENFNQHAGKKVMLVGTYTRMLLPQSKRPGSKMVESGRVSIAMGDFEVALERGKNGLRDKKEIGKFSGKKVRVIGTIEKMVTLWGNGEEQSIVMPGILEIESIELVK